MINNENIKKEENCKPREDENLSWSFWETTFFESHLSPRTLAIPVIQGHTTDGRVPPKYLFISSYFISHT